MKVQRKQGHEQYEVFEQTDKYYLAKADYWQNIIALPKADYEPVREWVDVTGVYGGITVNVPGLEDREFKLEIATKGYRLFERREA